MKELIYNHRNAIAIIDNFKLTSAIKPYLSFDFDELYYTQHENFYILNQNKYLLSNNNIDEINSFLDNLFKEKENSKINDVILSLKKYLDDTDWMIIRQIETGEKVPQTILDRRKDTRNKINEMKKYLK